MQLRRDRPPRAERKAPPPASGATWSLPRGLIVMLSVAGAVVAVMGMKAFAGVLGPTFLALMLTMAVQPVQTWVQRRGWRPWIGMVAALFLVVLILLVLIGALVLSVAQLASELPKYSDKLDDMLNGVRGTLADFGVDTEQIHNALNGLDVGKVVDLLSVALSNALGIFSNLFFVLALLLFMAIDGMMIDRKLAVVAKTRPEIAYALGVFAIGTRKYLVVSTVFGLIVAIFDGGALWLMGVPLPVLWALLSFITNYIPNIGFVIGLIPPALLALLDSGPMLMLWVIVVYSVINFVIQSIIQPKFVGDAVGLSVTVTFLSLVFWSWVLGALGALLAIPLTLLMKALLLDIDPTTRWVNVLIQDRAPDPDEEP
ncbi:AI-2E family transporter [Nocardia elegans]|uniref:AI-2E family transporter n=2 Tax=Nocardia TaxID=1817 RepID=A0A2T2Z5E7_9NOCA|nr:AI-2E family transporter [Nocardia elegans]MBF6451498.1 AI-2E family transporter [Nocardia elegans]PSR62960.1 AI-2E family transporter [Nocardia nova]